MAVRPNRPIEFSNRSSRRALGSIPTVSQTFCAVQRDKATHSAAHGQLGWSCYSQPVIMRSANLGPSMMLRTMIALGVLLVGTAAAQKNDFLIVPGQRVGPITAATTRADLDTLFGKENVRDGSFDSSEVPEAATVVLGNDTSAALAVTWDKERASNIHICFGTQSGPCRWRTASGIRIGLPLMELQKLNGKPFQLSGFGFEGEGSVISWREGLLEEDPNACGHLLVRLAPAAQVQGTPLSKQDSNLLKQVRGDKPYSSTTFAMVELHLSVTAVELQFVGQGCQPK